MPENKVAILTRRRDALGDPDNRIRAVRSGAEYRGRGRDTAWSGFRRGVFPMRQGPDG